MTQQRSNDEIRADLAHYDGLMDPACTDRLVADVAPLLARVSELEQERNDLRRVKGTDYEVVAYDGEAHVARHYEATSWDSPPEAELMGSVGDLIRKLDETEPEVQRLRAVIDGPCGSCHPCTNYAEETWRATGRKPPHVYQWDEMLARAERAEARNTQVEAALTIVRDWAFTVHGGTKSPADIWPGLAAALSGLSLQEEQE